MNYDDKYGNEEEFRQKYFQAHHQHYEDEMDTIDIFDILFGEAVMHGRGRRARNFHFRNKTNNAHFNDLGKIH